MNEILIFFLNKSSLSFVQDMKHTESININIKIVKIVL